MPRKVLVSLTTVLIMLFLITVVAIAQPIPYPNLLYIPIINKPEISSTQKPTPTIAPPTQTIEPTPTPTATNQPPSSVQILPNQSNYIDVLNSFHILGEVQNNTAYTLEFVKIIANFYNAANLLVGNDYTYIHLDSLPPGQKTCFQIWTDLPAGYSYYKFEPVSYDTDGEPILNLTLISHSGYYNASADWYELIGEVRNDHPTRINFISPRSHLL